MTISNLIANAKTVLEMEGPIDLFKQIIPLLFMSKNIIIFRRSLQQTGIIYPAGNFDLKIINCKNELLDLLKKGFTSNGFNIYDLSRRLDEGEVLFLVFSGYLLIHKTSLLMHDTGTIDSPVKIDWTKEAYIQFVETSPKYRGLHIYPYVTLKAFEYAHEKGKTVCVTSTTAENTSSIKAHLRAGYKISAKAHYTRLLLLFIFWKEA
jgi:hypothetical protein